MNSRNATKMVEHKLLSFATVTALWTLVALLIELIRILLKWKYIQDQNYAILGWSVLMGKFSSRLPRSLVNRASPASHVNTSIFLQRKEWMKPGQPGWLGFRDDSPRHSLLCKNIDVFT